MFRTRKSLIAAACLVSMMMLGGRAEAKCTTLGFSVNDYGKDGPTRDAKQLLDGYIEKWTQENGIKKYKTGEKTVECKLFLDVVVFDEYTCTARANVCW